jgi:hypothetical protein
MRPCDPSGLFAGAPTRSEQGFVGGLEALVFGLLIFVSGTLIVASAWGVVDTKFAAAAAAREAALSYVEAASPQSAGPDAQQAADEALAGYGRPPSQATISLAAGRFGRCQRITIEVHYPAPLVLVPFIGRLGRGWTVRATHSELVDAYRTGLPGSASCV